MVAYFVVSTLGSYEDLNYLKILNNLTSNLPNFHM